MLEKTCCVQTLAISQLLTKGWPVNIKPFQEQGRVVDLQDYEQEYKEEDHEDSHKRSCSPPRSNLTVLGI